MSFSTDNEDENYVFRSQKLKLLKSNFLKSSNLMVEPGTSPMASVYK